MPSLKDMLDDYRFKKNSNTVIMMKVIESKQCLLLTLIACPHALKRQVHSYVSMCCERPVRTVFATNIVWAPLVHSSHTSILMQVKYVLNTASGSVITTICEYQGKGAGHTLIYLEGVWTCKGCGNLDKFTSWYTQRLDSGEVKEDGTPVPVIPIVDKAVQQFIGITALLMQQEHVTASTAGLPTNNFKKLVRLMAEQTVLACVWKSDTGLDSNKEPQWSITAMKALQMPAAAGNSGSGGGGDGGGRNGPRTPSPSKRARQVALDDL